MQATDWINAVINVVIGGLLGVAVEGLARLITTALWTLAVVIPLLAVVLFFCMTLFDTVVDWFFPSGIRPARKPHMSRRLPLARRLSLPVGLVIGVVLAKLDVANSVIGWFL